jgi:hypothetical protein
MEQKQNTHEMIRGARVKHFGHKVDQAELHADRKNMAASTEPASLSML